MINLHLFKFSAPSSRKSLKFKLTHAPSLASSSASTTQSCSLLVRTVWLECSSFLIRSQKRKMLHSCLLSSFLRKFWSRKSVVMISKPKLSATRMTSRCTKMLTRSKMKMNFKPIRTRSINLKKRFANKKPITMAWAVKSKSRRIRLSWRVTKRLSTWDACTRRSLRLRSVNMKKKSTLITSATKSFYFRRKSRRRISANKFRRFTYYKKRNLSNKKLTTLSRSRRRIANASNCNQRLTSCWEWIRNSVRRSRMRPGQRLTLLKIRTRRSSSRLSTLVAKTKKIWLLCKLITNPTWVRRRDLPPTSRTNKRNWMSSLRLSTS